MGRDTGNQKVVSIIKETETIQASQFDREAATKRFHRVVQELLNSDNLTPMQRVKIESLEAIFVILQKL